MARKTNMIDKARKAYEDALAGIHIDIGSHNTNPRRAVKRKSAARPIRRAVRHANPTREQRVRKGTLNPRETVHINVNQIISELRGVKMTRLIRQANLSYAQGMIDISRELKIITDNEHQELRTQLLSAAK